MDKSKRLEGLHGRGQYVLSRTKQRVYIVPAFYQTYYSLLLRRSREETADAIQKDLAVVSNTFHMHANYVPS